ncbi:exodeoxyribonuclease VII small subunit [Helicobacter sp. 13S00401-1]|uniref:exodeoxyribonuclease VII small subunit n=1 Tax=Helicobacter sp. 13S00401-1 TaxID=1905758 RepID=UPI000BA603A4|nr:exodeoxyribonuclease VII small subunit [Helicobacter sp. 13S00401-1]PAF50782.1 exodeoxyribonuclease VII small subunit [Helicobacter sp. 13S00401-1]
MQKLDFETYCAKVDEIVQKMNDKDISLKESLRLYKNAKDYISKAEGLLENAKLELSVLDKTSQKSDE